MVKNSMEEISESTPLKQRAREAEIAVGSVEAEAASVVSVAAVEDSAVVTEISADAAEEVDEEAVAAALEAAVEASVVAEDAADLSAAEWTNSYLT